MIAVAITFKGQVHSEQEKIQTICWRENKLHYEPETRIETIFPKWLTNDIISALISNHPYEEVAYDIYPLENVHPQIGLGAIGELKIRWNWANFYL